jgi:hypothetical protein
MVWLMKKLKDSTLERVGFMEWQQAKTRVQQGVSWFVLLAD